jgi:hypothetical protein
VHHRLAPHARNDGIERVDTPRFDLVEIDVESGLVDLHDVDADRDEFVDFGTERVCERERGLRAARIVMVDERIDDRHRPGQRHLEALRGRRARETDLICVNRSRPAHRPDDRGTVGFIPIAANTATLESGRIDAIERSGKAVYEVVSGLLAVGDDIDSRANLFEERDARGVGLRGAQCVARDMPTRPKLLRFGEPIGFG